MSITENKVALAGKISSLIKPIEPIYGVDDLFQITVDVVRSSGAVDSLVCIFNINAFDFSNSEFNGKDDISKMKDKDVIIYGKLQTYIDEQRHLHVFVWAEYLTLGYAEPQNKVVLQGVIAHEPKHRITPLGREIADIFIKVPFMVGVQEALYEQSKKYSCFIPSICWGRTAKWAETLRIGKRISVVGRFQSRQYLKEGERKTAYELSIARMKLLDDLY